MITNLGFGGASITSIPDYSKVRKILEMSFDLGIRHYDTAPLYGKGYSELIYGKFIENKRHQITITTKFGLGGNIETKNLPLSILLPLNFILKKIRKPKPVNYFAINDPNIAELITKKQVEESFFKSIKRLKTSYIDYYLMHECLPNILTDEAKIFLLDLKTKGHILNSGIATNYLLINKLKISDVENYDVLQYEGYDEKIKNEILRKFSHKIHFHHSCLHKHFEPSLKTSTLNEDPGSILAKCADFNKDGKVIFSTTSKTRLVQNIKSFTNCFQKN